MIKMLYSQLSNAGFNQTMQKITSTPTHGNVASQIHRVTKVVSAAQKEMRKVFHAQMIGPYAKRDEKGEVIRPDGMPQGFEPDEAKYKEFEAAQEEFGKTEIELNVQPFTIQLFGDMKISAADLEVLGELYAGNRDDEKPGVPTNVANLR